MDVSAAHDTTVNGVSFNEDSRCFEAWFLKDGSPYLMGVIDAEFADHSPFFLKQWQYEIWMLYLNTPGVSGM